MSGYVIRAQVNAIVSGLTATPYGRGYRVESDSGVASARNLTAAIERAESVLGPILERAQRTGSAWGLHVSAGGAEALFGEWSPAPEAPDFRPSRRDDASVIAQIYDRWQRRDGTPLGALRAASEIIRFYTERSAREAA